MVPRNGNMEVGMTLYEAQKGNSYCIEGLYVEPVITRRLEALGLNDGTIINVLNRKKHGALIIRVRGTRLALGKHISSNIEISECQGETYESKASSGGELYVTSKVVSEEKTFETETFSNGESMSAQIDKGNEHEK